MEALFRSRVQLFMVTVLIICPMCSVALDKSFGEEFNQGVKRANQQLKKFSKDFKRELKEMQENRASQRMAPPVMTLAQRKENQRRIKFWKEREAISKKIQEKNDKYWNDFRERFYREWKSPRLAFEKAKREWESMDDSTISRVKEQVKKNVARKVNKVKGD